MATVEAATVADTVVEVVAMAEAAVVATAEVVDMVEEVVVIVCLTSVQACRLRNGT